MKNLRSLINRERLAQILFNIFVIAKRRFLRKKILGKSTRKAGNRDVKNTTVAPPVQKKIN